MIKTCQIRRATSGIYHICRILIPRAKGAGCVIENADAFIVAPRITQDACGNITVIAVENVTEVGVARFADRTVVENVVLDTPGGILAA